MPEVWVRDRDALGSWLLVFPILQVSGDSIMSFRDEFAFRRALSLATDKAINAGFFSAARLIDSNLVDHRIQRLELVGRSSLLGWLRRGREIKVLEIGSAGATSLDTLKGTLESIIKSSSFWNETEDVEIVIGQIKSARTLSALVDLFG